MISNCGHDERCKYSGGKAGDQTGTEWQIRSWYKKPWNCVIRFPSNVRELLASNAEKAAKNNLIGYDQSQRLTYYDHLKASGWDACKITVACEADCSSGVSANIIAAGYKLGIDKLKKFNKSNTTSTLRSACKAVGAEILTDSKYLKSDAYLLRGDIILKDGSHVATNITNGSKISEPLKTYVYNNVDYSLVFDPTYYSNTYADLKNAFGTNEKKLFNHFCQYGMKEGRQASKNFNVTIYRNNYEDLRKAYGDDLPSYYYHYIKYGYKEGRKAT